MTMKLFTKTLRFLLLLLFIEYIYSNPFMSVVIQKCYGTCNKTYCNASVRCRPLNRTSKLNTMDFRFRPGVKLESPINIEVIAYKKFRTLYRQHMLKLKTEFCSQLTPKSDHPFFSYFYASWKRQFEGNILDPCPISGHRYTKPYVSTYKHLPLVPVGEWKLEFTLSKILNNSEVFILSWTNFYEVKPTGAVEF